MSLKNSTELDMSSMQSSAKAAAGLLKAMANESRLMILCSLVGKELSVGELQQLVPLSQSALSQHLAALRSANLVRARREAQSKYYQLQGEEAMAVLGLLHELYCSTDDVVQMSKGNP